MKARPLKKWEYVLINSMIGYGIAFLTIMPTDQLPDTLTIYRSLIGLTVGFLLSLRVALKKIPIERAYAIIKSQDPENDCTKESQNKKGGNPPMLGVFI